MVSNHVDRRGERRAVGLADKQTRQVDNLDGNPVELAGKTVCVSKMIPKFDGITRRKFCLLSEGVQSGEASFADSVRVSSVPGSVQGCSLPPLVIIWYLE